MMTCVSQLPESSSATFRAEYLWDASCACLRGSRRQLAVYRVKLYRQGHGRHLYRNRRRLDMVGVECVFCAADNFTIEAVLA